MNEETGEKIEVPVKIRKLMPTDDEFQLRNEQVLQFFSFFIKFDNNLNQTFK